MAIERLQKFGISPREIQAKFIASLEDAAQEAHKVSLVHADTGIGKSLGMLAVALDWLDDGYRVIIATHTHKLIRQLAHVELALIAPNIAPGLYYGLSSYPSAERIRYLLAAESFDEPTTDYLEALSCFTGTLEDFFEEYGPLPDGIAEGQVNCVYGDENADVQYERELALSNPLVFTTHAALVNDAIYSRNLFKLNDKVVVLVDEADSFVDYVEATRYQTISVREVVDYLKENADKLSIDAITKITEEVILSQGGLTNAQYRELAAAFFSTINRITKGNAKWKKEFKVRFYPLFGYFPDAMFTTSPVRNYPQISISRPHVNSMVGAYLCQAHHSILISGTLSIKNDVRGMDWVISSLRLHDKVGVKAQFSPTNFGKLSFSLAAAEAGYPNVYVGNGQLSTRWVARVADDVRRYAQSGSVVVLTGSHAESEAIEEMVKKSDPYFKPAIYRHRSGESIKDPAQGFLETGGVLLTAAGHAGLNLVHRDGGLAFDALFITRIGMAPKDYEKARFLARLQSNMSGEVDVYRLQEASLRWEYSRNIVRAVRRIRQAIGRAVRSATHQAHVVICDPRFPLYENRSSRLSMLREAIPTRFKQAYKNASRESKERMEILF